MNNGLAFLTYKIFKEQICNNNEVAGNLLFSSTLVPDIEETDVLVLGNSDKHIIPAKEWCDALAHESALRITHIPNIIRTNDEYIKFLYYILPQKKIKKALILHCQFYGNCMFIQKKQCLSMHRSKYFQVLAGKYTYTLEALLYFIQTYMLYKTLCKHYGIKLIIIDNIINHNSVIWYILRKVYFPRSQELFHATRVYKNNLKKIVKFLKSDTHVA
jgi:hypothetical protein